MDLSERFPVTPGKVEALAARLRALGVDPRLIEESFTKGGGPGGQKINKTSNRVNLAYPPLGVAVHCQDSRSRSLNRFLALRELADQIEMKISPGTSARLKKIEKLRASKARAGRRARVKHNC